jgi:hypothetical protein
MDGLERHIQTKRYAKYQQKGCFFRNLPLKMEIDNILNDLINTLKASDPYKIILFWSYANGTEAKNSDIDLDEIEKTGKVIY